MTDFADLAMRVDTSDLAKGERAQDSFGRSAERMERKTTIAARGAGKAIGLLGVAIAGAFASGAIVNGISEFETSMSRVAAVSRATGDDLSAMRDIARDLGATTEFSASQAADGLGFLAMAGFNAKESIAAIPAVLDLATASGMGLASAADIASNVMSGFGIAADNAAGVTDVLAAASSRANTDVMQLGQAMSTVAPIAAALGISVEDTAAAIGVMSDAGIQGGRAGTALRGVFASLAGPTTQAQEALSKYGLTVNDVNPEMRSMADIMGDLGARGLTTADAMTIFGREAASGALVMVEGARRLGEFGDELRNVEGAAGDMAGVMRDNLGGDIRSLQSAVSGLILQMGDAGLTDVIRGAIGVLKNIVLVVSQLVDLFAWGFSKVENFKNAIFNLGLTSGQTQQAIDNVSLALGDEQRAIDAVSQSLPIGTNLSREAASAKLDEARAIYAKIEAARQEARATIMLSEEYRSLQGEVEALQQAGALLSGQGRSERDRFTPNAGREGFERNLELLQGTIRAQQDLLRSVDVGSEAYATAAETIERLEAALGATTGEIVTMGGTITELGNRTVVEFDNVETAISSAGGAVRDLGGDVIVATDAVEDMGQSVRSDLTRAWEDFIDGGLKDFDGFARSILKTFGRMLAQMILLGKNNPIQIGVGMGGGIGGMLSGLGGAQGGLAGMANTALAGVGGLSGLGSAVMGGASFLGSGITSGFAAGGIGGAISGGASAFATAMSGATMGLGGAAAALGAAIPVIGAVGLVFSAFRTKTKELDNGLNVAIDGLDVTAQTFRRIEKSRFFGLSKSRSTSMRDDPDNPIIGVVNEVQGSIMEAARVLGVGASAFEDFSHEFRVSLKGLSEDEKIAAINAELGKMGDGFAQLVPGMESANQVLERAAQISAAVRGMIATPGFRTLEDQIFAASQQGNLRQQSQSLDAAPTRRDEEKTQGILERVLEAIRNGNYNSALLQSKLVALQQRAELAPE